MRQDNHGEMRIMPRKRSIFTLVELLVVIAIISILSAMLLPALKHAKEVVQFTDCKNNIRSITQAIQFYVDENDGYVPNLRADPTNGYPSYWAYLLVPHLYPGIPIAAGQAARKYQFPIFWDCAAVNGKRNFEYDSQIAYGMNRIIYDKFGGVYRPFKIAKVPRCSETIAAGDSCATYDGSGLHDDRAYWLNYVKGYGYPHFRHLNRAGISFLDGHVDAFGEKDICGDAANNAIKYGYWTFE